MPVSQRPRSVTRACVLAGGGALFALAGVLTRASSPMPAENRAELESLLAGSGTSVDTVLVVLRVLLMISALGCVATLVLAVFTIRRQAGARTALTVIAPITALTSLVVGLADVLLVAGAVACLASLWDRDASAWFVTPSAGSPPGAGQVPPPPGAATPSPKERSPAMSTTPPNDPGQPGSYPAHPGPSYPGPAYPAPGASPYGQYGPGYGGPMVPRQRPGTVTAAAIITIVMAAITGLGWALIAVVWAAKHDQFESSLLNDQQFSSLNLTRSDLDNIGSAIYVLAVLFALVCLLAIALAVFVLKGRNWARIALVILSAITALLALLAVLGQGWLAIVWLAAAVAVIVLLFAGRAGAWFDSRGYAGDASRAAY